MNGQKTHIWLTSLHTNTAFLIDSSTLVLWTMCANLDVWERRSRIWACRHYNSLHQGVQNSVPKAAVSVFTLPLQVLYDHTIYNYKNVLECFLRRKHPWQYENHSLKTTDLGDIDWFLSCLHINWNFHASFRSDHRLARYSELCSHCSALRLRAGWPH